MPSRLRRRVSTPDGRAWVVQLVWWPRPGLYGTAAAVGTTSAVVGLILDAIHVVFWPIVLAFRLVLHRRWLIEAFQSDDSTEGAAWQVHGLAASVSAVDAIATGIETGKPAPCTPRGVSDPVSDQARLTSQLRLAGDATWLGQLSGMPLKVA